MLYYPTVSDILGTLPAEEQAELLALLAEHRQDDEPAEERQR